MYTLFSSSRDSGIHRRTGDKQVVGKLAEHIQIEHIHHTWTAVEGRTAAGVWRLVEMSCQSAASSPGIMTILISILLIHVFLCY